MLDNPVNETGKAEVHLIGIYLRHVSLEIGLSPLVLGAYGVSNFAGAAYVIYGRPSFPAVFNLSLLDGNNGFVMYGISSLDRLGCSVSTAADINGDGKTDLVLGALGTSGDAGAAYVIYGGGTPTHAFAWIIGGTVGGMLALTGLLGLGYLLKRRFSSPDTERTLLINAERPTEDNSSIQTSQYPGTFFNGAQEKVKIPQQENIAAGHTFSNV